MSAKLLNIFVNTVKELLHSQKLSQTDFAQKLGVSRQTVSQFITGEHAPRLDKVEDISEALGVPAFYLLMGPEERARWDDISKPKTDLSAIERRLAALEGAKPSLASPQSDPPPSPQDFAALLQEMQRVIGDPPLKKTSSKKGNG
jgi:transcriptional regulator with XRE-family HTH domain